MENKNNPEQDAKIFFYATLGENLRNKRQRLKLTQEDIAWMTRVSRISINNIEAGKQRAPLHFIISICKCLSIELGDVLPDYEYGIATLEELKKHKALAYFDKKCSHEAMEHIISTTGKEYYICPQCNYSKEI